MIRVLAPPCPSCGAICVMVTPLPPEPTDEQIFGRECETCAGGGKRFASVQVASGVRIGMQPTDQPCRFCNGTGRVGGAENRWRCVNAMPPHAQCSNAGDVTASASDWAELCKAWRTRTKTTVVRGDTACLPLNDILPVTKPGARGTWTIAVTFEPEDA